jgi:hypothetical protein
MRNWGIIITIFYSGILVPFPLIDCPLFTQGD